MKLTETVENNKLVAFFGETYGRPPAPCTSHLLAPVQDKGWLQKTLVSHKIGLLQFCLQILGPTSWYCRFSYEFSIVTITNTRPNILVSPFLIFSFEFTLFSLFHPLTICFLCLLISCIFWSDFQFLTFYFLIPFVIANFVWFTVIFSYWHLRLQIQEASI